MKKLISLAIIGLALSGLSLASAKGVASYAKGVKESKATTHFCNCQVYCDNFGSCWINCVGDCR